MSETLQLEGILPALVTSLIENCSDIDEEGLAKLVRRQVGAGVGGLISCGRTGEFEGAVPVISTHRRTFDGRSHRAEPSCTVGRAYENVFSRSRAVINVSETRNATRRRHHECQRIYQA